ncbi:MAG TPA: hypothetical protein VH639_19595 [Bryobacteraceae bacterium]|jgi:hypothetical protein
MRFRTRHLWADLCCGAAFGTSWPVSYDRLVTVKGKAVDFTWANPHPMMTLEVQTADGQKIVRLERVVPADGKELRLYAPK